MANKSTTKTESSAFVATDAQLKEWKQKHGEVFEISLKPDADDPSRDRRAYIRKPKREHFKMVNTLGGDEHLDRMEALMDALWLDGDEDVRSNDDYFLNAIPYLQSLIPTFAVELIKK